MKKGNKYVIKLGGSEAFQKEIDTKFLGEFKDFILKEIKNGNKFIIIVGGGYVARKYIDAISKISEIVDEDKDWIGIHSTRLNAHFLRTIFRKQAHPALLKKRFRVKNFSKHSIIIGAGWEPGHSTDFDAVQSATDFKIKKVIVLGKPDYVYTSDFRIDKNAKPIEKMTWNEYFKLIPKEWTPGMSAPVDPIAARLAKKEGIEVIVAKGSDLKNLKNIIDKKPFKGTTITS